jgi:hypothetical protein
MEQKKLVWAIDWLEFEEGWGPRPDGHSLHVSLKNAIRFMGEEIRRYQGIHTSDPDGTPYKIDVPLTFYDNIQKTGGNLKVESLNW